MLATARLTAVTVPISLVSKARGLNLSREIFSNISQHPLQLGVEAPVQDHVLQPDDHAGHQRLIEGFVHGDGPAPGRREDPLKPLPLGRGERKRHDDVDRVGLEPRSAPVGLPDLLDELVDQMLVDALRHRGGEHTPEDVRRQAHRLFFHFRHEARPHSLSFCFGLRHDPLAIRLGLRQELVPHFMGGRLRFGPEPSDLLVMPGQRRPQLLLRLLASPLELLLPLPVLLVEPLEPSQRAGGLPVEKLMQEDGQDHERDDLNEQELPEQHARHRTNRWKMTTRAITAMASAKTKARIMEVWILGAAEGLRATAWMLEYPMTAITK